MTARKPIVIGGNGLPQQLQAGDSIVGGGGVNLVTALPVAGSSNRGNLYQLQATALYKTSVLLDNPQHYYDLADAVGAISVSDLGVGTVYNSTSINTLTFGSQGGCSDKTTSVLNTTNGDIAFATTAQLLPTATDWAFECAFNLTGVTANNNLLIMIGASGANYINVQVQTNGQMRILASVGSFAFTGFTFVPGTWYLVQVNYNHTTQVATLIANGVSQGTVTCTSLVIPTVGTGGGSWICGGGSGSGLYLTAYSQKYAFYNAQLTPTQYANHYTYWVTAGLNDTLWIGEELQAGSYQMTQVYETLAFPNVIRGVADLNGIPGLDLWLAARKITGVATGAAITTWNDSSGNGRNYTGVNSPTWQPASINNLPAVAFNGSNQYFKPASVYNPTGKMTIMLVVRYSSGNPFSNAKTPSPGGGMTYANNGGQHLFQASNGVAGWANTNFASQGLIDTSNYQLVAIRIGYGMLQMCVNGVSCANGTVSFTPIVATGDATYGLLLGALNNNGSLVGFMNGNIAEFVLWTKVLDEFWWAYAQDYLTNLYQIAT